MKTENPWLHRYAIFVAFVALLAIAAGALLTSLEHPLAPRTLLVYFDPAAYRSGVWHHMIGGVAVVLALGLAIWLRSQAGWIALLAALIEGGLGFDSPGPILPILHALFAQILFGSLVAIAMQTSASWKRGPEPIDDTWNPSMRSLSYAVPLIILLQTTLGAAYRYHAIGVIWHIMNAMLVLLLILIVAVFLIRQFPTHPTLRPAAVALAVITSIQVLLGFTTFMMLILFPETSLAVVITSVLHVATGALTLGAGYALAILIRYNVRDTRSLTGQ